MIIQPPIIFDNKSKFTPDRQVHHWAMMSGYDNLGRRVTNLVGHDGQYFIKFCPNCLKEKPEMDFGYNGRDTGEPTRRDQSNCTECRGRYNK